jgi:hypothetical protein
MKNCNTKGGSFNFPEALKNIYIVALKDNAKIESFSNNRAYTIWSRKKSSDVGDYIPFWAELSEHGGVILDDRGLNINIQEVLNVKSEYINFDIAMRIFNGE